MKLKLTESQYKSLLSYINESRPTPTPVILSGFFNKNPETNYFSVVKLTQKTKDESEYLFEYRDVNKLPYIKDKNQGTPTRGCETFVNLDGMIYDDEFQVKFKDCQKTLKINDVVGIRLFDKDKNLLDEMKFKNTASTDNEELAGKYNDQLEVLTISDEVYFTTPTKQYDGVVLNKSSDKIEIEIHEKGKNTVALLYVVFGRNGFYVENNNLFFDAIKKDAAKNTEKDFLIPIKNFSTSKSGNEDDEPEVNEPTEEPGEIEEPGTDEPNGQLDSPESTEWQSEKEIMAQAKAAYDEILKDKDLQKAFYRKPSFWNLFMSELKGEKAKGKGILPTIQMVGDVKSNKIDSNLKGEFKENEQVYFSLYGREEPVIIYDKNGVELRVFEVGEEYNGRVKRFNIVDSYRELIHRENLNRYTVKIKSPTEKENVYLCDISASKQTNKKKTSGIEEDIYILLDPNSSKGYKPLNKIN